MASTVNWKLFEDPAVAERCRNALRDDGVMILRGFAVPPGLERLKKEVAGSPFNESEQHYTPWQDQGDAKYPEQHPRNFKMDSSASFVSRKTLERANERLGMSIFEDERLLDFLSNVAGRRLYRSRDENGSIYAYRIHRGHRPPWHFDESPYTAIIYLQNSESGGEFELVPWSRSSTSKDDGEGHGVVEQVLMKSDTSRVRQVVTDPGALLFFCGARSFHRAVPVGGDAVRIGLVFTFGESEGFANSKDVEGANEWDPDVRAEER